MKQQQKQAGIMVFYSYAPADKEWRDQLAIHLSQLKRDGLIEEWHEQQVLAGSDRAQTIDQAIYEATIILLLISADFLASDSCYHVEMRHALERHKQGEAQVVPIIVRPCDWQHSPFAHLQCLPRDSKPITTWDNRDEAFAAIAQELRRIIVRQPFPRPSLWYVPYFRNPLFQSRPGEFENLERILCRRETAQMPVHLGLVGMVGMGGVGKTQLAVELAYRLRQDFPDGVFWMTATGTSVSDWQHQLAELAFNANYLPFEDDPSHPGNEARRAYHLCHYLAIHTKALLILDNVEEPAMIVSVLPALAGGELACTLLYTSRSRLALPGIAIHSVEQLSEEGALRLLLGTTRPSVLAEILAGGKNTEACAARTVCQGVGYLPLALVHLHSLLVRDQRLTLTRLAKVLQQRGALELAQVQQGNVQPLFATFRLSWEKVRDEEARRLLKLASYFPEATPIPLWLLGLAGGLGESGEIFEPLGKVCVQLQELSLLEALSGEQVRLHPLVREFTQRLVTEETHKGGILIEEAGVQLAAEFTDLNRLEDRARREGYWRCLEQIREAYAYVGLLGTHHAEQLRRIERWLDRESYLLGDKGLWPERVPGLFYQQLFNRSLEEDYTISARKAPGQWLRQIGRVGAEDQALLRIFTGHTDGVTSVAFSPDGTKILTGSEDQTARLWEVTSGKILVTLIGHTSHVTSVAFSPDGTKILTGSYDRTARLWEAVGGRMLTKFVGHTDQVTSVAFTPDGTKVLTGSSDRTARLWETASGTLLTTLQTQDDYKGKVTSVAFSPDGTKILAGSSDNKVRLWETEKGTLLFTLLTTQVENANGVMSVAFSPDGTKILTSTWDEKKNEMLRLWDASSEVLLTTLTITSYTGSANDAKISPDGSTVLAGFWDGVARLWKIAGGRELAMLRGHERKITSVAFSPDGTKILTGGIDHTARLWETAKGSLLKPPPERGASQVMSVAFSPDGTRILIGSSDGSIQLWEIGSKTLLRTFTPKIVDPSVVFSSDGTKMLAHSGSISLWDVVSGRHLAKLDDIANILAGAMEVAKFSPDGSKVLVASLHDHTARIWETASGKLLVELLGHTDKVQNVAFSPDGEKALTWGSDYTARLWETASGTLLITWGERSAQAPVAGAALSPDGMNIFICQLDGTVQLWEIASGTILMTGQGHISGVNRVIFYPDGAKVLVCYIMIDKYFKKYSEKDVLRKNSLEAKPGEEWLGDEEISAGARYELMLWEVSSGRRLSLEGHAGWIRFMMFSPDGHFLITCDQRGYVFLWGASGSNLGNLLGIYVAAHEVMAVHWQSSNDLLLADWGGSQWYPYLYQLKLEGMGEM